MPPLSFKHCGAKRRSFIWEASMSYEHLDTLPLALPPKSNLFSNVEVGGASNIVRREVKRRARNWSLNTLAVGPASDASDSGLPSTLVVGTRHADVKYFAWPTSSGFEIPQRPDPAFS